MYIKTLLIFLTLSFFTTCGASISVPSDSSSYFYALGYGETQKDAKSDALATISAKISVSVASNFSNSVTANRQSDKEDVLSTTKSEVVSQSKDIEYTDVKVLQSIDEAKGWSVLVQVDRTVLSATYERKLQKVDASIKAEWEIYQDAGYFEKLKLSSAINKYLKQTDQYFPLLYALNSNYDDSKYSSRYMNYTKEMRKAQRELVFKIESDKNSEPLASLIRSELSAVNATFNNKKYNVRIIITTKVKKRKYRSTNEKFSKLTFALRKTVIKATDRVGNVVSNVIYKTKSGSSEGYEDAIARTAKYESMIEKLGIISFITGN